MILSGHDLSLYTVFHEGRARKVVEPFEQRTRLHGMTYGLSIAGYDVRMKEALDLMPGQFTLGSLVEHIVMPLNLVGIVHDKSTLARMGLALQNTVIEPGWTGYLTVEISNHGNERVRLPAGSPIAQILFHVTSSPCVGYTGKYQDQGPAPQPAIMEQDE